MSIKKSMMAKRAEETEQQKAKRRMSNKLSMVTKRAEEPSNRKLFVETLTKLTKELRKVTVPKRSIKFETKKLLHLNEHQVSR